MSKEDSQESQSWLDFKEPKKVAIGLGALVATVGVGVFTVKNGKKIFIAHGDRRMEAKGLKSIGELEQGGTALSVVKSEEAFDKALGRDLFSMDKEDGFAYPQEDPQNVLGHGSKYLRAAKKIYEVLKDHLPAPDGAETDQQRAEKE
jgi:hypothetical protein